jgi:hypothetical protein
LPALYVFNLQTAMFFSKDKYFIRSLDKAKESFDKIYISLKNSSEYSLESIFKRELL